MDAFDKIKYIYIRELYSIKKKLRLLENKGVTFRAAYMGYDEVFTAVFPDGTFLDYHWLESTDSQDCQFIAPMQFERILNETIKYGINYGWVEDEFKPSVTTN